MKMRKETLNFTAVIYPDADSDWLVAHNPETGTTTQGKTFEEALANLKEATELYLSEFPPATKGRAILTTFEVVIADPCLNSRMFQARRRGALWSDWDLFLDGRAAAM